MERGDADMLDLGWDTVLVCSPKNGLEEEVIIKARADCSDELAVSGNDIHEGQNIDLFRRKTPEDLLYRFHYLVNLGLYTWSFLTLENLTVVNAHVINYSSKTRFFSNAAYDCNVFFI